MELIGSTPGGPLSLLLALSHRHLLNLLAIPHLALPGSVDQTVISPSFSLCRACYPWRFLLSCSFSLASLTTLTSGPYIRVRLLLTLCSSIVRLSSSPSYIRSACTAAEHLTVHFRALRLHFIHQPRDETELTIPFRLQPQLHSLRTFLSVGRGSDHDQGLVLLCQLRLINFVSVINHFSRHACLRPTLPIPVDSSLRLPLANSSSLIQL